MGGKKDQYCPISYRGAGAEVYHGANSTTKVCLGGLPFKKGLTGLQKLRQGTEAPARSPSWSPPAFALCNYYEVQKQLTDVDAANSITSQPDKTQRQKGRGQVRLCITQCSFPQGLSAEGEDNGNELLLL